MLRLLQRPLLSVVARRFSVSPVAPSVESMKQDAVIYGTALMTDGLLLALTVTSLCMFCFSRQRVSYWEWLYTKRVM